MTHEEVLSLNPNDNHSSIMKHRIVTFFLFLFLGVCYFHANAQVEITMEKKGGVFLLPGKINGLELQFVFDTGASDVYLSMTEALFMVKNGYLSPNDFTGKVSQSLVANGTVEENMEVLLKEVEIGGIVLSNVRAMVSKQFDAPLLLGQSAIQKLGPIQLEGNRLIITTKNAQSDEVILKQLTDRAFTLAEYGDLDESLEVSMKVIKMTNNPLLLSGIYDNIGFIYYSKGDLGKAANAYKRATEMNPASVQSAYNYGVMLFEQQKYQEATTVFKNVVQYPQNAFTADAYAYLGNAQMTLGEANNAMNSFLSSLKIKPNSSADFGLADYFYSVHEPLRAVQYFEDGIAFEPDRPSNVKRLYQLGCCYLEGKSLEKAKEAFRRCENLVGKLWADKNTGELSTNLTMLFAEHMYYATRSSVRLARIAENPIEIVRQYTKVWGMHESGAFDIIDYLRYAGTLAEVGDTERALTIVTTALKNKPKNPDLLFAASFFSEDPKERLTFLLDIIPQEYEYAPIYFDYGTVYNNIAWAYHCLGESEKGLSYSEKSVKKNPEHAYSWETLGEIYYNLGRYSECIDSMTKCISCNDPDMFKAAYLYRGKALIKLGKKKEGQKDLKYSDEL